MQVHAAYVACAGFMMMAVTYSSPLLVFPHSIASTTKMNATSQAG
jgi:hypothetical protein